MIYFKRATLFYENNIWKITHISETNAFLAKLDYEEKYEDIISFLRTFTNITQILTLKKEYENPDILLCTHYYATIYVFSKDHPLYKKIKKEWKL